jgi:hypothetical protein
VSELPAVRRADCGHYIPATAEPVATDAVHGQPVYLCDDCRGRLSARRVETKPGPTLEAKVVDFPVATTKASVVLPVNPELAEDESPRAAGRDAALMGAERRVPAGIHPRSAWARDWLAAYDEAKAPDAHGGRTAEPD